MSTTVHNNTNNMSLQTSNDTNIRKTANGEDDFLVVRNNKNSSVFRIEHHINKDGTRNVKNEDETSHIVFDYNLYYILDVMKNISNIDNPNLNDIKIKDIYNSETPYILIEDKEMLQADWMKLSAKKNNINHFVVRDEMLRYVNETFKPVERFKCSEDDTTIYVECVKKNVNCTNCTNCIGCVNCINCTNCAQSTNTFYSSDVFETEKCFGITESHMMTDCTNCHQCSILRNCHGCRKCGMCDDCGMCKKCRHCKNCFNCEYFEGESGLESEVGSD